MPYQPCPVHGTHQMYPGGRAEVSDKTGESMSSKYDIIQYYECDCGARHVTEGQPHEQRSILYHIYNGYLKFLGSTSEQADVYSFEVDEDNISYTTATSLSGFEFKELY
ncbi:hypothetical protein [Salimicrobium salexigens]|uniref:Uncharacterized protein n=1 Tax=Salimicrobium salexigens TaxID=908941 RepID=A0ABY1KR03_9BACI|nr:hypothetical protein [Salimicrobium salexigens]SIS66914.1 hypothetical protein SAMN05421758_103285 [Salimicrobium salexigens]